jgi:hypothetical protein
VLLIGRDPGGPLAARWPRADTTIRRLSYDRIDGETREAPPPAVGGCADLCLRCPVTGAVSESLDWSAVFVTWGNEDPNCRIDAGQSDYFARSPVVGKSDTAATRSAGRE